MAPNNHPSPSGPAPPPHQPPGQGPAMNPALAALIGCSNNATESKKPQSFPEAFTAESIKKLDPAEFEKEHPHDKKLSLACAWKWTFAAPISQTAPLNSQWYNTPAHYRHDAVPQFRHVVDILEWYGECKRKNHAFTPKELHVLRGAVLLYEHVKAQNSALRSYKLDTTHLSILYELIGMLHSRSPFEVNQDQVDTCRTHVFFTHGAFQHLGPSASMSDAENERQRKYWELRHHQPVAFVASALGHPDPKVYAEGIRHIQSRAHHLSPDIPIPFTLNGFTKE